LVLPTPALYTATYHVAFEDSKQWCSNEIVLFRDGYGQCPSSCRRLPPQMIEKSLNAWNLSKKLMRALVLCMKGTNSLMHFTHSLTFTMKQFLEGRSFAVYSKLVCMGEFAIWFVDIRVFSLSRLKVQCANRFWLFVSKGISS
jgi:hypothetical protein